MIETFFHPHLGLSPSGPADRAVVATITSDPMIRERWCYYAGGGCRPADVTALSRLLSEEKDRSAVLLGSTLYVARTDPVAAMQQAVTLDDDGHRGLERGKVFTDIVASVKDPAVFPALEPEANRASTAAWELLVKRWAMEDGAGLIRHVNAHPDNFSSDDVGGALVVMTRVTGGAARAFEAVQDLSNPEHFERGVGVLIPYLAGSHEKEMIALAEQIQSPSGRAAALQQIKDNPESMRGLP